MTDHLFQPEAFEQIPGQLSIEQVSYEYRRHCHTVGRDPNKYHLVPRGSTEALCGRSTRDFNACLAEGYETQVRDAGLVCSRCGAKS